LLEGTLEMQWEHLLSSDLRVVLVGQERVGKSAAGNTILGRREFLSGFSSKPLTLQSERRGGDVLGRRVTVVDTPGLFSSRLSEKEVKAQLEEALRLSAPGPQAFLLTLQLGHFTQQEQKGLETLEKMLCPAVRHHTIVLFTYGDRLGDTDIYQFVREDENLQNLVQKCGGRYHAVRCISLAAPGPHVFLVVIQLRRLTREEQKTVETIQGAFGREVGGYTMVLFTHGDDWDPKEIIRQFPCISNLIQQCHGGYHVFNNRSEDPSQVAELLEKIKNMVQRNGGRHFTHEKLEEAEEAISQEMRRLMRNDPDLTREEVRKMAERNNAFIRKGLGVFGVFGAAVETIAGACIIQ
uniref:GTPase IMAP family member 8 n=1 Tax=Myripristis murdjan TaxID=586833 RepID=A0A667WW66_9TELE